ncbi:MAG: hypothetical protein NTX65_12525 [Ignavibacteriales bacterium]|nr:hypothetical protein [Ignavibacteriales bacterium]
MEDEEEIETTNIFKFIFAAITRISIGVIIGYAMLHSKLLTIITECYNGLSDTAMFVIGVILAWGILHRVAKD